MRAYLHANVPFIHIQVTSTRRAQIPSENVPDSLCHSGGTNRIMKCRVSLFN